MTWRLSRVPCHLGAVELRRPCCAALLGKDALPLSFLLFNFPPPPPLQLASLSLSLSLQRVAVVHQYSLNLRATHPPCRTHSSTSPDLSPNESEKTALSRPPLAVELVEGELPCHAVVVHAVEEVVVVLEVLVVDVVELEGEGEEVPLMLLLPAGNDENGMMKSWTRWDILGVVDSTPRRRWKRRKKARRVRWRMMRWRRRRRRG